MKKVSIVLLALLCAMSVNASKKGKRVVVRRSAHCAFAGITEHRAPARERVSLYQEENILHINSLVQMVTITFKDEDGTILSQEMFVGEENDVEIPDGATIVEVTYGEVELVGMLY